MIRNMFLLALMACLPLPAGAVCKEEYGEAFVVCIPNEAVFKRSAIEDLDFITYSITGGGLPSVVVYEGNHPQPMPRPKGVKVRRRRVGEFRGVSHTYWSWGAEISFVQIRVKRGDWPEFVEFSFVTRTEGEAESVSRMLSSMVKRKPPR